MSIKNIFRTKAPAPTPAPAQRRVQFAEFDRLILEPKREKGARRAARVSVHYGQSPAQAANCNVPNDLRRPPRGRQAADQASTPLDQLARASTFEDFARIPGNDLPTEPQQAPNAAARQLDQIAKAATFDDIARLLGN
ncbi:MAG: hypothetical protein GTN84_16960 [Hydrogenophaga sp.]|uniref:hypothetical protein n=1 Tax=Hydrogenophaga sp. TaxID=1904254 RepID=UPI0016BB613B|nr:hypothetical protein [Hydrogenophaga sp.]NIM42271.1 hypothetical protein [Hydrogenophaga sp.]NIN28003.1 hypothetical protein [Hydrogenophaga sp.]NIN32781.1 hypothetical protein [Hydrogenophaga sp.]NIN54670.1 hypothetical protein [Hydrogenophaga sp.]NIO51346.1 hypothetical protein [Hydrogenophaga sp.]